MPQHTARVTRDEPVIRAIAPGPELRAADAAAEASENPNGMPTLFGYGARFNEWTPISSYFEGEFLESIAPGAFRKTIRERGEQIRCLFQHGYDPVVGDKPLGPFDVLREDGEGLYYEVPLLATSYNDDLVPGLESGLYGASFRMRVTREEFDEDPGVSDHNPEGLPERTIKEIQLFELGPVTFPAYDGATADCRSLTDNFAFDGLTRDPDRLRSLVKFSEHMEARARIEAPSPAPSDDADAEAETEARSETDTAVAEATGEASTDAEQDTTRTSPTAPPTDDAGTRSHLTRGRRDHKRAPLLSGATTRKKGRHSWLS